MGLQRVRELAVQASNDTNSTTDREYLQKEVDSLLNEINRVASQTVYNDQVVLDGTHTGQIQVGTDSGQSIAFAIKSIDTDTLGLTGSAAVTGVTGVTGVASVDTAATTALLTAVNGATAGTDNVAFSAFGSTLTFAVEAASANTADTVSQETSNGTAAADVDTLLADIQAHSGYSAANFTAKTAGANAARATYTVGSGSAVDFNQTTAGVTAVTAVTAAAAGATSGAFTAGSTPAVIATTANDNSVDSSGSAQTPSATGDNVLGLSVLTADDAEAALTKITAAVEQVAGNRAEYGALSNRLEYTVSNLMNVAEFTTSARSRIEDADFAAESARLAKAQVLQQTGAAMLAQANASSQKMRRLRVKRRESRIQIPRKRICKGKK